YDTASRARFWLQMGSTVCRSRRPAFSRAIPARSSARSMAGTRPVSARSTRRDRLQSSGSGQWVAIPPCRSLKPEVRSLNAMSKIRVAGAGGTGYMGVELLRLLALHPRVDIRRVTSEQYAGKHLADVYPAFRERLDLRLEELNRGRLAEDVDVVFSGLPHG